MSENNLPALQERPASEAAIMLTAAIEKGIDAEGIKALAEVYRDMEARQAEKDFNADLVSFQDECPAIVKRQAITFATKKGGTFNSRFAPLPSTVALIRPLLRKYGFTFTFNTKLENKVATVTCRLAHSQGHKTETDFSIPLDSAPLLSDAHAAASAVSFAERYALQLALGLVPQVDDDGKRAFTVEKLNEAQVAELRELLTVRNPDPEKFWTFVGKGMEKLEDIASYDFERVKSALVHVKRKEEGK